jgi:hypothetical protein
MCSVLFSVLLSLGAEVNPEESAHQGVNYSRNRSEDSSYCASIETYTMPTAILGSSIGWLIASIGFKLGKDRARERTTIRDEGDRTG